MRYYIFSLILSIFLFSFTKDEAGNSPQGTLELKKFYFPYTKMFDTLVYHYKTDNTKSSDIYWIMFTTSNGKDTLFHSFNYENINSTFLNVENMKEEISEKGSILIKYRTLFVTHFNETKVFKSKIKTGQVFLWKLEAGDSLHFELTSKSEKGSKDVFVSDKTRKFFKWDTLSIKGQNKPVKSVCFKEKFKSITLTNRKSVKESIEYTRTTWYAENIGFVKMIQQYGTQVTTAELVEIIPFQKSDKRDQFRAIMEK